MQENHCTIVSSLFDYFLYRALPKHEEEITNVTNDLDLDTRTIPLQMSVTTFQF